MKIGASSSFIDQITAHGIDSSSSISHLNPMLSLDSAPDKKAVCSFIRRLGDSEQLIGEPKIDGLRLSSRAPICIYVMYRFIWLWVLSFLIGAGIE